jgi:hypothetical protein
LSGIGTLAAAGAAWLSALASRRSARGQITDRYTKAVSQLGDKNLDVRLGGIFALERIAHDSRRDRPTVVEVLRAFVQEHSQPRPGGQRLSAGRSHPHGGTRVAGDVQAGIDVLMRLPGKPGLPKARLGGANLSEAELGGVELSGAELSGANLTGVNLGGADLSGAELSGADLSKTNGLTQEQLNSAHSDDQTRLPLGLHGPHPISH